MPLDKSLLAGSTTMLVLKLLDGQDMYGYQMIEELARRSDHAFALKTGTLYPLLHSLEEKELIISYEKDEDAALVNLICVNLDEYARAYNDKAVKKTLSIPAWLNTACENYGINYSKVLQDALIAKIQARS